LEKLIASILAAKQEVERELTSKSVLYKPKTRSEVENTIGLLGFKAPSELFDSMKEIVKASAGILGFEFREPFKVVRGMGMPTTLNTVSDIYGFLKKEEIESVSLIAYGNAERVVALLPVQVVDKKTNIVLYRELIGIDENSKIFRGSELLKLVSQAISGCLGVEDDKEKQEIPEDLKKEVEEKAVKFVMEIERSEGRIPEIVPDREHYDIRSTDPSTGETRIIEVKGHWRNEIYAELTHDEAKLAEEESERYWLYIVYKAAIPSF